VQYQLLDLYQVGAYRVTGFNASVIPDQSIFWVDVCSGQVKLRTGGPGILDFEGVNQYILTVRAFVAGFTGAETVRNVTINVLNLDEPPIAVTTAVSIPENAASRVDGTTLVWNSLSGYLAGTMGSWDPENSTVRYAVTVDGSSGKLVMNGTTGAVTVPLSVGNGSSSAVDFNFESLTTSFTLSVTVSQVNDTSMSSSAAFTVTLLDQNDPPTMVPGQVLYLSEYASALNPGSTQYPVLAGAVIAFDEDTNATWTNSTTFTLVSTAQAGTACGQTGKWATNSGLQGGTPLFSIAPATGAVTLTTNPNVGAATEWRLQNPIVESGKLLRASYQICVRASDAAGASSTQLVGVSILADLPSIPYIDNIAGNQPEPSTVGGTTITFTGANFMPGGATLALVAFYTNAKGVRYNGVGCLIVNNATITCRTQPGYGKGYTWSFTIGGNPVTPLIPLTMDYADPSVTSFNAIAQNIPTAGGVAIGFFGTNFGPNPSQNPKPAYVYNHSFPTVIFGNNGNEFTCPVTFWNHTYLECTAPPGLGKDLAWTITVGDASTAASVGSPSNRLLAYRTPTITSVTGSSAAVDITRLDTYGGQAVVITGTNFGPAQVTWRQDGTVHTTLTDPLYGNAYVKVGGAAGSLLSFVGCTQAPATAHTTITCFTPAAVGINHRVSIMIGNQAGNVWPAAAGNATGSACASGLCYLPPVLTSISGPGSAAADTVAVNSLSSQVVTSVPSLSQLPPSTMSTMAHPQDLTRPSTVASSAL